MASEKQIQLVTKVLDEKGTVRNSSDRLNIQGSLARYCNIHVADSSTGREQGAAIYVAMVERIRQADWASMDGKAASDYIGTLLNNGTRESCIIKVFQRMFPQTDPRSLVA